MKVGTKFVASVLALVLVHGSAIAQSEAVDDQADAPEVAAASQPPVIAAGGIAGIYYPVATIIAASAGDEFEVLATSGSIENLVRLSLGDVDFAIALSDRVDQAVAGAPPFEDGAIDTLRTVVALFPEPLTVLVRADDDIGSLTDLQGRAVNLGEAGNPSERLFRLALDAAGLILEEDAFETVPLVDQADALCAGEVDAVAYLAAHPSGTVYQATMTCDLRILPIAGSVAAAMLADDAALIAAEIPPDIYPGIVSPVDSVGPIALLMTTVDVDPALVDGLAGSILDSLPAMAGSHPSLSDLDRYLGMTEASPAEMHPSAAALLVETPTQ